MLPLVGRAGFARLGCYSGGLAGRFLFAFPFLLFFFVFFYFVTVLEFKQCQNILNNFMLLLWTIPKAHKIYQRHLEIYSIYYEYKSKFKYNSDLNSEPK